MSCMIECSLSPLFKDNRFMSWFCSLGLMYLSKLQLNSLWFNEIYHTYLGKLWPIILHNYHIKFVSTYDVNWNKVVYYLWGNFGECLSLNTFVKIVAHNENEPSFHVDPFPKWRRIMALRWIIVAMVAITVAP